MTTTTELSPARILRMQQDQYSHDCRNHFDILSLHKTDRLKHYGLHFCKYVGRFARKNSESKSALRTTVDAALVCLSAANTLHQRLAIGDRSLFEGGSDALCVFADAAGRFADACEKIDHLEDFVAIASTANQDIFIWILSFATINQIDLQNKLMERRQELRQRHFYIP